MNMHIESNRSLDVESWIEAIELISNKFYYAHNLTQFQIPRVHSSDLVGWLIDS